MTTDVLSPEALEYFTVWAATAERWEQLPYPMRPEVIVEHARDILDADMLGIVWQLQRTPYWPYDGMKDPHWVSQWDLAGALRLAGYRAHHGPYGMPSGLVRAKASRLIERGLLDGCTCGCRGDFELTTAGRGLLEGPVTVPEPDILDELHQRLLDSMDQTPERPWQRVSHRREVFEDGTVIDFGVNDVRW